MVLIDDEEAAKSRNENETCREGNVRRFVCLEKMGGFILLDLQPPPKKVCDRHDFL